MLAEILRSGRDAAFCTASGSVDNTALKSHLTHGRKAESASQSVALGGGWSFSDRSKIYKKYSDCGLWSMTGES